MLSKEVAIVVAVMTNSEELVIRIEKEEREEVDMCQVLEEFKLESEMRGLERGRSLGLKQGIKQGLNQGIKQGIKQGLDQGVKQGKIQTIVNQLKSKFGFVSKELIMKIEESSDDKIDALTIKIIDARSEEELMKVLS